MPFLFHLLELCLSRLPWGTRFIAVKSSDTSKVRGPDVIVIYWLHYSCKSCGKLLNHWPLASERVYQGKTLHIYPFVHTPISPAMSMGFRLSKPLLWCGRQFPWAANERLSGASIAANNTLIFPFVLCLLSFDDLTGHPKQRRLLAFQSRHLAASCAVAQYQPKMFPWLLGKRAATICRRFI